MTTILTYPLTIMLVTFRTVHWLVLLIGLLVIIQLCLLTTLLALTTVSLHKLVPKPVNDFGDFHWVDSDTHTDDDDSDKDDVVSQVNEWANKYGLPHVAVTELMHILKPHLSALPNDSRSLLHTPRSCNITHLKGGGDYCHLGLAKCLQELLKNGPLHQTLSLELQFNIDGMSLFKSSNLSLWPILCLLKNPVYGEPFVVGIYHGNEKPADSIGA